MAIKQLIDLSVDGTVTVSGSFSSPGDLITLYNTNNGQGAGIRFSDQNNSSQKGFLKFYHSDSSSHGGGSSFKLTSTEDDLVLAVGDADATHGRIAVWSGVSNTEPDYGFAQDTNTGMLRTGSDAIRFVTGGSAVVDFDSSQNATFAGDITVGGGTITLDGTSFTKESVFITRTPTVGTTSDWDDFTQQGTYGVASSGGAQFTGDNRPVATAGAYTFEPDYRYGHLVVTEDSSSQGIQQTYYPHSGNQRVFTRTGWSNGSWGDWTMNWNTKGFTTVGTAFTQLGNVSVPSYIRVNADETLSYLDSDQFIAAIGGQTSDVSAGQVAFGDGTGLNGDGHLYWDSTNNRLGIGTQSPGADLHIEDAGNSSSGIRIEAIGSANTDTVNMHFQGSAGNAPFYISRAQTGGAEIQIQADGDLILNGTNGDNVGIGTTTPQQKLHVSNNILCGGNLYFNTGTSNYIKGTGGGLEWYTNSNKIVDITYAGDVEVTNNLDIGNTKLLTWGALGGTTPTTYIQGQDNGSRLFFVGNFNYDYSNSTDGNFVFKNSNNNGTTSGSYGVVMDIVTDSTATGSINTGIRFGRDKGMSNGYNKYTGSIDYISTNQVSGEKMIFKCAQYSFLQANGTPSSGLDSIKIGGNTNNQIGYIDLWGDSGGGKPFFNIQDTRYQPSTDLSNPVVRIQNNFHSTNSRYQIVFQRFSSTSSIRGSIATNNSGTTYNTTSDYRLKTDAKDFDALDLVKQIPVYDFKWKNIDNRDYGCFAHELAEVIPNAVNGEKDAETEDGDKDYQQADYSKIVPVLLKAIQELEAKVKILENK